jgi:hypothetical protein
VDGLEAAVRSLLRDLRDDGQALREAARADAEAHFAVRTVVGQLIDIISSVAPGPAMRSLAGADQLVAAGREGA